jgi:hypothetical protein
MATASGAGDRLDRRALNGATLARQLLLGRVELPVTETVARLGGLNAQDVEPPYLTLWARLAGCEPTERLGGRLRRFRDERGRQLYDLPDAPRPDPEAPSPVRFLPPFDNLLLAHADRTRVMTDEVRRRVCVGAVVEPTVLVDGQVAAVWRLRRDGDRAVVEVEPLGRLVGPDREAVATEGLRLLRFAAPDAADHDVRVG